MTTQTESNVISVNFNRVPQAAVEPKNTLADEEAAVRATLSTLNSMSPARLDTKHIWQLRASIEMSLQMIRDEIAGRSGHSA